MKVLLAILGLVCLFCFIIALNLKTDLLFMGLKLNRDVFLIGAAVIMAVLVVLVFYMKGKS